MSCAPFPRRYSGHPNWFLFLPLLRCFSSGGSRSLPGAPGVHPWQEVPFGDPRIQACLRLPGAYGSLPPPSSAPEPSHPPGGVAANTAERAGPSQAGASAPGSPSGSWEWWAEPVRGVSPSRLTPPPHQAGLLPGPLPPAGAGAGRLFSGAASGLDAFSPYRPGARLPGAALSDDRYTGGPDTPFLSY